MFEALKEFLQNLLGPDTPVYLTWLTLWATLIGVFNSGLDAVNRDMPTATKQRFGAWLVGAIQRGEGRSTAIGSFLDLYQWAFRGRIIGFRAIIVTSLLSIGLMTFFSILMWFAYRGTGLFPAGSTGTPSVVSLFGFGPRFDDHWAAYRYTANLFIDQLSIAQTLLFLHLLARLRHGFGLLIFLPLDLFLTLLIFTIVNSLTFQLIDVCHWKFSCWVDRGDSHNFGLAHWSFAGVFAQMEQNFVWLFRFFIPSLREGGLSSPDWVGGILSTFVITFWFYLHLLSKLGVQLISAVAAPIRRFVAVWNPAENPIIAVKWSLLLIVTLICLGGGVLTAMNAGDGLPVRTSHLSAAPRS